MNKKKKTTIYPDNLIKTIFGENSTFDKEIFEKWLEETINSLTPREAKEKMLNVDYEYQKQKQEAEARGQTNIFDFIEKE